MDVRELLQGIEILKITGDFSGEAASVCYDSRKCGRNSLFVAVKGLKFDGHDFIGQAVAGGAAVIVHEKDIPPVSALCVKVADSRKALGTIAKNFYRDPSRELCVIGVTGTSGKTTTSYLLESVFRAAGSRVGVLGTINYRYGGNVFPAPNTTPESLELQRILREMADAGVNHVIMEVSSHALDLGRVDDCSFDLGVFTNLSPEHLDYHPGMDEYFAAKRRLFELLKSSPKKFRPNIVVNIDDPWGRKLFDEYRDGALGFAIEQEADYTANHILLDIEGSRAAILGPYGEFFIRSPLIGKYNLYNILAACAAACCLQIPEFMVQAGIVAAEKIPGRLEKVSLPGEPAVFVDYAHKEDALEKVLQNLSEFKQRRIITVFGCGGDRDRLKRPHMGGISTTLSDFTIITSDNPRSEDPLEIIRQIEAGVNSNAEKYEAAEVREIDRKGYTVIPDRRAAIAKAVGLAQPGDIVLIAGKGHETYQILGNKTIAFDDREAGRDALDRLGKSGATRKAEA
ncbi:MAG: UDP-N-acetylmuramoyl-L-alanyl-D-glutamate--2,6-diaminopimelate ligase [Syntrophaceae bacterium]